jgi:PAS domain S-box-containing protein
MTRKLKHARLWHGVVWLAAIFLLTWLFVQAQGIDPERHQKILKDFGEVNRLDGKIEVELLKLRYQLARDDASLNVDTQKLHSLSNDLNSDVEMLGTSSAAVAAALKMHDALDARIRLIEQLKSKISILKNELASFPIQVRRFQEKNRGQSALDAEALLLDILSYNVSPTPENRTAINHSGDRLSATALAATSPLRRDIDALLIGYADILANGEEINRLLQKLTTQSMPLAHALTSVYLEAVQQRAEKAQEYRVFLFVAALVVLLYAISAFTNLREKTVELEDALGELKNQKFALDQHAIVSTANVRGDITYANQRFCEISKYELSELLGQNHRILNSGEHQPVLFKEMWQTITQGGVWHGQVKNRAKDGSHYWVDATIVPFLNERGKPYEYISIRTDISAQKALEADLIRAKEAAESASKAKSQFLAAMSHEIRTPMNGIIGMTDLTLDSNLDPEQREYLGIVKHSAEHLLVILNDILDFSKIEAGHLELEVEVFSLRETLNTVLRPLSLSAANKHLALRWAVADSVPDSVAGDQVRLRQVLFNLVNNALKFTKDGQVSVDLLLENSREKQIELRAVVADTGIGIPFEKLEHIFDPFSQADASTTRKYGGTGLGLAICRRVVELMGGRIWAESQPGEGSQFIFTCLLEVVAEALEKQAAVPAASDKAAAVRPLSILLVEDNAINRKLALRLLEKQGHQVRNAEDGLRALDIWRGGGIDLILMDVMMAEMDGLAATRAIRAEESEYGLPRVPIVAMTANAFEQDRLACLAAGMDGYVSKPIKVALLESEIARVTLRNAPPTSPG